MLEELRVENLLIIDELDIAFGDGMNVLSGETGVGKSMVLAAARALFGERLPAAEGADKETRVEGRFRITEATRKRLADLEFLRIEDELVVRVVKKPGGAQRSYVNGSPLAREELRALGERLVDVHGQRDMQRLFAEREQCAALDRFARTDEPAQRYRALHAKWGELERRAKTRDEIERGLRDRIDLLRYQKRELDDLAPTAGEFAEISARVRLVRRAADTVAALNAAQELVSGDDGGTARLAKASKVLERAATDDPEVLALVSRVDSLLDELNDVSGDLAALGDRRASLDDDPADLERKVDALQRAFRKYRTDEAGLIVERGRIGAELERAEAELESLENLDHETAAAGKALLAAGLELARSRRLAADRLETAVAAELSQLKLAEARFAVDVGPLELKTLPEDVSPLGFGRPRFLWCANPGFGLVGLGEAASGGELSRLMLALHSILADSHDVPLMVFDEIETGVGPRLGHLLGKRLAKLATHRQVLCITHLPQIAAFASRHLKIDKEVASGRTKVRVDVLTGTRRIDELAAMLGGGDKALARRQAKSLLAGDGAESAAEET